MYRLTLLGGVALVGPDGPMEGRATQQRRLALLALLGSAGDRGRSRDQLISLLWPETDPSDARQHLSHSIYVLRRTLGQEAVRTSGEYVRLSAAEVRVDMSDFRAALGAGDPATAAAAYTGPFMDGFFIDDAPEFERWVESERQQLAAEYARCLEELGRGADGAGHHDEAAEWWGRLVSHDPYNSAAVVRLMDALASSGDPANAIQHAEEHIDLLQAEFGMGAPEDVVAKIEELRSSGETRLRSVGVHRPAMHPGGYGSPVAGQSEAATRFRPRTVLVSAVLLAILAVVWSVRAPPDEVLEFIPNAVLVREAENLTGDSALDGVGRYASYVLEGRLSGVEAVRVVTTQEAGDVQTGLEAAENLAGVDLRREIARQTRAGMVIESSYLVERDSLLLEARLIEPARGTVVEGVQAGAARTDPGAAVRALADRVLIAVATRLNLGEEYASSYGRGSSYQAWQEVDAARELWVERGREREAFALLYRALEIDSTFDAAVGLAMIWHMNFGEIARSDSMANVLERRFSQISPHQRWQLAVNRAVLRRDRAGMVEAFRRWKDRLPIVSRWLHLAASQDVAQHSPECIESLDQVDLEANRYYRSGWLWQLYAGCHRRLGNYDAVLHWARGGLEAIPDSRDLAIEEVLALSALGRTAEAERRIAELLFQPQSGETFEHDRAFALLVDSGLEMRAHGYGDAADASLALAVEWYARRVRGDAPSAPDRWRLGRALYAARRWEEAAEVFSGLSSDDLSAHPDLLAHNVDISLVGYRATLAARLGDRETAEALDAQLAGIERPFLWGDATYWRAALAAVKGDSVRATRLLGQAMGEGLFALQWGSEYPKWDYHVDPDFEILRDYEPFQRLIEPRD